MFLILFVFQRQAATDLSRPLENEIQDDAINRSPQLLRLHKFRADLLDLGYGACLAGAVSHICQNI
jgi:hypothetical protein